MNVITDRMNVITDSVVCHVRSSLEDIWVHKISCSRFYCNIYVVIYENAASLFVLPLSKDDLVSILK
jgi:small basic protein